MSDFNTKPAEPLWSCSKKLSNPVLKHQSGRFSVELFDTLVGTEEKFSSQRVCFELANRLPLCAYDLVPFDADGFHHHINQGSIHLASLSLANFGDNIHAIHHFSENRMPTI